MAANIEAIQEGVKRWLEPISPQAPAGVSAKFEPSFEALQKEMAKLTSASAGSASFVDWAAVVSQGGNILEKSSKDILVASYVAYGLYATSGLDGLARGICLLNGLVEGYWPTLFPELSRIRGRANALGWLMERLGPPLSTHPVSAGDRDILQALDEMAKGFAQRVREKFDGQAPSLKPMTDGIARLILSVPAEAPPPPPQPQAPEGSPPPPPPRAENAPAKAAAAVPPPVAQFSGEIPTFLRQSGGGLMSLASQLRSANTADPLAYRLWRSGLWLRVTELPRADSDGRTGISPLDPDLRNELDEMLNRRRWAVLLDKSEDALGQNLFCMDLNRYSALALEGLGEGHRLAKDALVSEVRAFLARFPKVPQLSTREGGSCTSPQAALWLEAEVTPPAASGLTPPASGASGALDLEEAQKLLRTGKVEEAIALLGGQIQSAGNGRERFRLRLALAEMAIAGGKPRLGAALYESLDRESQNRALEEWEPELAVQCLVGLLSSAKAGMGSGATLAQDFASPYGRLCRLNPEAALRIVS